MKLVLVCQEGNRLIMQQSFLYEQLWSQEVPVLLLPEIEGFQQVFHSILPFTVTETIHPPWAGLKVNTEIGAIENLLFTYRRPFVTHESLNIATRIPNWKRVPTKILSARPAGCFSKNRANRTENTYVSHLGICVSVPPEYLIPRNITKPAIRGKTK
jgi:hypothetical protein